jgi:hypothetical protein
LLEAVVLEQRRQLLVHRLLMLVAVAVRRRELPTLAVWEGQVVAVTVLAVRVMLHLVRRTRAVVVVVQKPRLLVAALWTAVPVW